ncbi:MAG: peptidoglycan D,D-transpeptidase FtsI family protein [Anaerolineae bacterium]
MNETSRWKRQPVAAPRLPTLEDEADASRFAGDLPPTASLPVSPWRIWLVVAFFIVIILAITVRTVYWALAGGPVPDDPPAQVQDVPRGRIVDRNGLLLATDAFSWEAYARPQKIAGDNERDQVIADVARILGQDADAVRASLAVTYTLVTLARDLDEKQARELNALGRLAEVWADDRRVRVYPLGALAAHLIGFTNYTRQGLYGVEAGYDGWLMGRADLPAAQTARRPQPLPDAWRIYLPSPGRHDLVLHMDAALQHVVERHLAEAVAFHQATGGTIIVMDPRNGGILALANYPTYDPNRYPAANPEWWANAAVSGRYEPGSVFKLVTIAAALDAGLVTPDQTFTDPGVLTVDGQPIRNAENKAYGVVTVQYALAKSINVVTARICLDMGADTFYRYVRQFGFGSLTEVDLNLEDAGFLKEPGNPYWSRFDQATNSFGQALLVTPLQMVNAVATIANGGTRYQPQAARALVQDDQVYELPARILGYPIRPETAKALTRMMVYNVESASYRGFVPGYKVAGKTGTAEISTASGYTTQDTITSFVGFLPAADPQIVILVKLDRPKSSRWAEQVAVPVFGKVAQDAVRILRIPADARDP